MSPPRSGSTGPYPTRRRPSRRLKPAFARQLARVSARNHVDWALGARRSPFTVVTGGAVPASKTRLQTLAKQLHSLHSKRNAWSSVLSLGGRTTFADQTIALRNLYRAVGLKALVKGFDWAKPSPLEADPERQADHDLPGWPLRHREHASTSGARIIAYIAEAHGQVDGLVPDQRAPAVRPAGSHLGAHLRLAADISTSAASRSSAPAGRR